MKRMIYALLTISLYIVLLYISSFALRFMFDGLMSTGFGYYIFILLPALFILIIGFSGLITIKWRELKQTEILIIILTISFIISQSVLLIFLVKFSYNWLENDFRVIYAVMSSFPIAFTISILIFWQIQVRRNDIPQSKAKERSI